MLLTAFELSFLFFFGGLIIKHGADVVCVDSPNFLLSSAMSMLDVIKLMC